jgi:hypothetical protein
MAGNKYNWDSGKPEEKYLLVINDNHKAIGTAKQLIRQLLKLI